MRITVIKSATLLLVVLLFAGLWRPGALSAQEPLWSRPANLSRSGAASGPALVTGEDGQLYAFWWDRYDGLTVSARSGNAWGDPLPAPVVDYTFDAAGDLRLNTQTGAYLRANIRENGTILGDGGNGVNVFFLAQSEGSDAPALRQVRANLTDLAWTDAVSIVSSVTGWRAALGADGTIHMLVFYAGRSETLNPGIYYMQSVDGGATWGDMSLIAESLYVRRASPETNHIRLVEGQGGSLYATWNEPATNRALWSWSRDNGQTWTQPQLVDSGDANASYAHVGSTADGQIVMLWQGTGSGTAPTLHYSISPDGGHNWALAESALSRLDSSANLELTTGPEGQILLVSGGIEDGPALAVFDIGLDDSARVSWSDVATLSYPSGTAASLTASGVNTWQASYIGNLLVLAGQDESNDIWSLETDVTSLVWKDSGPATWVDAPPDLSDATHMLTESGALSAPVLVSGPGAARQAYWWDAVEGLYSAYGDGEIWYQAERAQTYAPVSGDPGGIPPFGAELQTNGTLTGAFWIDTGPEGQGPVLYSSQIPGQHAWTAAVTVAENAADMRAVPGPGASWHVLFTRIVATEEQPAGLYHTYLAAETGEWTPPVLLAEFTTLPGMPDSRGALDLVVTDRGIAAAWADPVAGIEASVSQDAGASWSEPASISLGISSARRPRLASRDDGYIVIFESLTGDGVQIYQCELTEQGVLVDPPAALRHVSDGSVMDDAWNLLGVQTDQLLLSVVENPGEVSVARWLSTSITGGWESAQSIPLSGSPGAPVPYEPVSIDVRYAGQSLLIAASGHLGQASVVEIPASDQGWDVDEDRGWSWPQRVATPSDGVGTPLAQIDREGRVHVLWSAGEPGGAALWYTRLAEGSWTEPAPVVQPQDGTVLDPSLVVLGQRVYAAWSAGDNGRIDTANAFASDAYAGSSWTRAETLPGPVSPRNAIGSAPDLARDLGGTVHAIYAIPINQYRGIYYTRSQDEGATWETATVVFDAAATGWPMVDEPTLAVDHDGTLYAAWLRMDVAGLPQPRALYLSRSRDYGRTWSDARLVAEGAFASPEFFIGATGEPHLLWQDAQGGKGVWHSWSADGGDAWSLPMRVRGFASVAGAAAAVTDEAGTVYLGAVLSENDSSPAMQTAIWDGVAQQWALEPAWLLPEAVLSAEDVTLALDPDTGELISLLTAVVTTTDGEMRTLLFSARAVPPRSVTPEWAGEVQPEPAAETEPTPDPTPTMRPPVDLDAPPPGDGSVDVGPLTVPILSIGGLVLVALIVAGVMITRGRAKH